MYRLPTRNIDVADVEYMPNGREYYLRRHGFDVRDVDFTSLAPAIDVADVEFDVAHVDFGNKALTIDVRDVEHTLRAPNIDVGDVEYMPNGREYYLRRHVFDVRDVDFTFLVHAIDVADVEIDVAHVDFGHDGLAIDVRDVEHALRGSKIDVADVDCMLLGHVFVLLGHGLDVGGVDNRLMQRENEPPDVEVAPVEVVTDAPSDAPLAVREEPLPPVVPDRATLIRGFRLLAERIPGFTHLSPEETRKLIRASELDEETVSAALVAADVWDRAESTLWLGMPFDEFRELDTAIRDTDDVIGELRILLKGMEGANRVRRHRRGKAIFNLYKGLQIHVNSHNGHANYMRPYFENLQRAYMKNRKRKKEKEPVASPPPPEGTAGSADGS